LCGSSDVAIIGEFLPNIPSVYSDIPVREGKQRAYFYGLCKDCSEIPNFTNLIENKLKIEKSELLN
jgi:hypothetical protein